uniref:Uncharacterized protein n=1 Tax=Oreochromis aureus TaxID=47969 RepID=A0AAZ1Y074_OREAU
MIAGKAYMEHHNQVAGIVCHVCSETLKDPVTLICNHSFCLNCLQQFWEQAKNTNCPICKRKSSKGDPRVNFKKLTVVCRKHEEEPKLFCVDEQRAVCSVCDFPHQQSHKVVPVKEAVSVLKKHLKSYLKSLAEFNKLQQFLKEEEESRLAALREEEEQKGRTISREMRMIEEQISSLSDSISAVEEELQKHTKLNSQISQTLLHSLFLLPPLPYH